MPLFSLKDSAAGRDSRSAFVAIASFWFGAVKFALSGITITVAGHSFIFAAVDPWLLIFFLGSAYGLYWGRRFTDVWSALKGQAPPPPVQPATSPTGGQP